MNCLSDFFSRFSVKELSIYQIWNDCTNSNGKAENLKYVPAAKRKKYSQTKGRIEGHKEFFSAQKWMDFYE